MSFLTDIMSANEEFRWCYKAQNNMMANPKFFRGTKAITYPFVMSTLPSVLPGTSQYRGALVQSIEAIGTRATRLIVNVHHDVLSDIASWYPGRDTISPLTTVKLP
jgi:hypothetical protein